MSILIIGEHDNTSINSSTLHAVSAAKQLGQNIELLIIGSQCQQVIDQCKTIDGIQTVNVVDHENYIHQLAEDIAPLIVKIINNGSYTHVLTPATTFGKNFMPRVAAQLDVDQISDVIKIIDNDIFKRPIYAGNAIATVKSTASIHVMTIRPTAFDKANYGNHEASINPIDALPLTNLSTFKEDIVEKTERPQLNEASIVVSGGRGVGSGDNFKIIYDLADQLGAAVGASRAAVDAGFVANDLQVGQTGKIVAPELYIAVGISGAIQHLAGMKDSKIIVAINKDEEAPIFQIADYGLVGDLFKLVPELTEKLT